MSYPNYNTTMIGDSLDPVTITVPNNTSNGLYWGLNGTSTITLTEPSLKGSTLKVNGDADITGELTVQGVKLIDRLDKIEERLAILHPNLKLEDKWDELKELGNRYRELEQELIEKEKVWAILKK